MSWCLRGVVCGLLLFAAAAEARDTARLHVSAGLDGLVKPGRWVPVRIVVDSGSAPLSGELVVAWGTSTLRRPVSLATPGSRLVEMHVRTADPGSAVHVSLEGTGATAVNVPVTVLSYDRQVTLCIATVDAWLPDAARCSVTLPPERLPLSLRGYDVVDEVIVALDERALTASQRLALDRWRALRALEAAGDLALTPQVTRPLVRRGLPTPTARALATSAAVYASVLLLIAIVTRLAAPRAWTIWTAAVLLVGLSAVSTSVIGHVGASRHITLHHTSLLQQIPGSTASLLTTRAIAVFPAHDAFAIRMPLDDAMLQAAGPGEMAQREDAQALPLLTGRYGMGARQAFAAEAVAEFHPIELIEDGRTMTFSNRSNVLLEECRLAHGLTGDAATDLAPGERVTAERIGEIVGPVFTCTLRDLPLTIVDAGRPLTTTGATLVAVYRNRLEHARRAEGPDE